MQEHTTSFSTPLSPPIPMRPPQPSPTPGVRNGCSSGWTAQAQARDRRIDYRSVPNPGERIAAWADPMCRYSPGDSSRDSFFALPCLRPSDTLRRWGHGRGANQTKPTPQPPHTALPQGRLAPEIVPLQVSNGDLPLHTLPHNATPAGVHEEAGDVDPGLRGMFDVLTRSLQHRECDAQHVHRCLELPGIGLMKRRGLAISTPQGRARAAAPVGAGAAFTGAGAAPVGPGAS